MIKNIVYKKDTIESIRIKDDSIFSLNLIINKSINVELCIIFESDFIKSQEVYVLNKNSSLKLTYISFSKVEKDASFILSDSNCELDVNEIVISDNAYTSIFNIDHKAKSTMTNFNINGMLFSNSNVFIEIKGKIHKGSCLSEHRQKTRFLLLDEDVNCKMKPSLLIDENEVKASHALAIGKINDEDMFYLTSRGLDKKSAILIVMMGYINPIIGKIKDEIIRLELINKISDKVKTYA